MSDSYQHPVFFEGPSLQQQQIMNIERYLIRKSGRGECGPLRHVKNKRDQQEVLQRREHVVDGVRFSVRGSPVSSPITTSSAGRDFTAPVQASRSAQESIQPEIFTNDTPAVTPRRIVLLGKTGSGKSHLANTIVGENYFIVNHSSNSEKIVGQSKTKSVHGRMITLIDTPGLFDTNRPEEDLKSDILTCMTNCSPGPHVFLIVLKVDTFTKQEQEVITKIQQRFSEEALKYAVIVFTYGDQLQEGVTIEEFVRQNKNLSDLVQKCGGRCHVVDNKYWQNRVENNYRSNQVQVKNLLNTIDKMVTENNGTYYSNKIFETVDREIQEVEANIRRLSTGHIPGEEIRKQAETTVIRRLWLQLVGTATGVVLGAFFGVEIMIRVVWKHLKDIFKMTDNLADVARTVDSVVPAAGSAAMDRGSVATVGGYAAAGYAFAGGVIGGVVGYDAVNGAETTMEAIEKASGALCKDREVLLKKFGL